jgi:hypothetical protein
LVDHLFHPFRFSCLDISGAICDSQAQFAAKEQKVKQKENKKHRVTVSFTASEYARLKAAAGPFYVAPPLFVYQAAMQRIDKAEAEAAAGKPLMGGE